MPLFGPPNVEKLKFKRNVRGLIRMLSYKKDERVRWAAAQALGQLGDTRAVEPLLAVLKDASWRVRAESAQALGQLGDTRAAGPLVAALEEDTEFAMFEVRTATARALGQLGDTRAVEPLLAVLKDADFDVKQSRFTDELNAFPFMESRLQKIGNSQTVDLRVVAAKALGQLGDAQAVEPLVTALSDKSWSVRRAVSNALTELGWQPKDDAQRVAQVIAEQVWARTVSLGAVAVGPLVTALMDDDDLVRYSAVLALGQLGDTRAVGPLVTALMDDYNLVRSAAAQVLEQLGIARHVGQLVNQIKTVGAGRFLMTGDSGKEVARSMLAILKSELERASADIAVNELRTIAALSDMPILSYVHDCGTFGGNGTVDFTQVKQLARQELIRRGLQA